MGNDNLIKVCVITGKRSEFWTLIPRDITEIQLKARLKDLGYISSYLKPYRTTRVYLLDNGEKVEICLDQDRTLEELNIVEGSRIQIVPGEPEPKPIRYVYPTTYVNYRGSGGSSGGGRVLYGCPMAESVKEAINEAEQYSEEDSSTTTGFIDITD